LITCLNVFDGIGNEGLLDQYGGPNTLLFSRRIFLGVSTSPYGGPDALYSRAKNIFWGYQLLRMSNGVGQSLAEPGAGRQHASSWAGAPLNLCTQLFIYASRLKLTSSKSAMEIVALGLPFGFNSDFRLFHGPTS
jgi:hypothetical protein